MVMKCVAKSGTCAAVAEMLCLVLVFLTLRAFGDGNSITYSLSGPKKEIFVAPTGSSFDYYRFAVDSDGKRTAQFFSESGTIQPDAYAPEWTAKALGKDTVIEIPLSSFYMTRNGKWKTTWLETTTTDADGRPIGWQRKSGRPQRAEEDDLAVLTANAEIRHVHDGSLSGDLVLEVFAAKAGDFDVEVSCGGKTTCRLQSDRNKIRVPCAYRANGRHPTHVRIVRRGSQTAMGRDIPVIVDYSPIAVRLSKPQYRDNFYPGQDCSHISGNVLADGVGPVTLRVEGPGFPVREKTLPSGGGDFVFDTAGFEEGVATLTVKAGRHEKRVLVRNLPDTGRRMIWVENGHLVVNGMPVFRRNIYSEGLLTGLAFNERFHGERGTFRITDKEFGRTIQIEPGSVIPGLEEREARSDKRPCEEYLRKLDAIWEKNKDVDFSAWYISDEPECRHVSPIYLKHVYEHVKNLDPYHPVFMASRGGKTYIDCADWFETHPYLDCRREPDGRRTYGTHPCEVSRFIDAFEATDRPDKVIGFMPTCFAYRWTSITCDYPTFDEYLAHTWAAIIAGAKTLWPYAGHDLGDRPALYEGTRLVFRQAAAYEKLLLLGKRTRFRREHDVDRATWELDGETLDVMVDYKTMKTVVKAPVRYDAEVEPLSAVAKRVAKAEAERKGRDNQLRGRYDDIMFSSNMKGNWGGGYYKLIDGTRDMIAKCSSSITNAYVEASFVTFTPAFDKVRIWGRGIDTAYIEIRKNGRWVRLVPKTAKTDGDCREFVFDKAYTTVKMRVCVPGRAGQHNDIEIYEIEVPRTKEMAESRTRRRNPVPIDEGRIWELNSSNAVNSGKSGSSGWYGGDNIVEPLAEGGFKLKNHGTHRVEIEPAARWLVIDVARFRDTTQKGYRRWDCLLAGTGVTTVTHPEAGIYTLELPMFDKPAKVPMQVYIWGVEADVNYIACMKSPSNRVICRVAKGCEVVSRGDVVTVGVSLAEPCEEVAAEFLVARMTGDMKPFLVNGVSGIELKPVDGVGCRWAATVPVNSCGEAPKGAVYVRASALGSSFKRPVIGKFEVPFASAGR